MKKMAAVLIILALILSGCGKTQKRPICPVVTHIDVERHSPAGTVRFRFEDDQKMEAILLYLRLVPRKGRAGAEVLKTCADIWRICVYRSDGKHQLFTQKADRYMWKNGQSWGLIDPQIGSRLSKLMALLPADKML